jgi:LysR family hydrogen peroxide-inducible transcriptional activator
MELHQLRYFVAVAETGSFTRAAERCGIAQPSLSQQIQRLESQLRHTLFDRMGRRVLLTEAGKELLGRATAILAAVDEAERALRDGLDPAHGHLALGAIPTVAPYLLPSVLSAFVRRYPAVQTTVQENFTEHLLVALLAGELDLAILALPVRDERLQTEVLRTDPLLVALPRGHRLASKRKIRLEELTEERFILLNEMHCLGGQVASFCRQQSFAPPVSCRTAQLSTVQQLIDRGLGVSLLPALAREADRGSARVYRELAGPPLVRTLAAVWHRQRYLSPTTRLFLEQLKLMCRSLV